MNTMFKKGDRVRVFGSNGTVVSVELNWNTTQGAKPTYKIQFADGAIDHYHASQMCLLERTYEGVEALNRIYGGVR